MLYSVPFTEGIPAIQVGLVATTGAYRLSGTDIGLPKYRLAPCAGAILNTPEVTGVKDPPLAEAVIVQPVPVPLGMMELKIATPLLFVFKGPVPVAVIDAQIPLIAKVIGTPGMLLLVATWTVDIVSPDTEFVGATVKLKVGSAGRISKVL